MSKPKVVVVGSLNMDIVVEAKRAPQIGETVHGEQVHFIPGGKGANQAVAVARLGAQTHMIGAVGADGFGEALLHALKKDKIDHSGVKVLPEVATGIASIVVAEGDNQIIVVAGANGLCTPEDVKKNEQRIADSDVLLVQLEIPLETVAAAVDLAHQHRRTVILNPAPARELPQEMLAKVDLITPNRSELAILTGLPTGTEDELKEAMRALANRGIRHVVTTLGSEGSAFLDEQGQMHRIPAYCVPVVDTTGAGDAFNAGLAYGLSVYQNVEQAVRFASKVSALSVTKFGAQSGMPTLVEIETTKLVGEEQ